MEPKCTGVSINEIHTTSDATDNLSQKSPAASQSHEHHQQNLDVEQASMPAGDLQSTAPPRLTVLDEIQVLKEQIRHLQIQTKAAPLNSQEAQLQAVSEQNETIQHMKECLRNHSHEWDFRDGLESYSTTDAIERALGRIANREQDKNMAGAYFLIGEAKMADSFLHRFYDSDNDDDDDNYEERQLREQLMVKRREFLKSMELKIETITEGLMRIRLTKKLRKQQKAAELERVAEMRAAEMREAEMRAAEVLEQGARNEPSSLPDIKQEDFPILKPEAYQYALAKVNPIDWSSFKALGSMTESDSCVIDVLIGEPLVTEEVSADQKIRRGKGGELETYPEQDRCRRSLINRGAKFVAVAAVKHMYYSGPTMVVGEEVESQVVIDFETAFATKDELQEHVKRPLLKNFIGEIIDSKDKEESSDQVCACCCFDVVYNDGTFVDKSQRNEYINSLLSKKLPEEPPSVALFPRLFSEMQMGSTEEPDFSDEDGLLCPIECLDLFYAAENGETAFERKDTAFGRLVLEDGHKKMIVSLITQHFRDKEVKGSQTEQVDIIRGKGKGLILLLHGAPGVGKTSTAGDLGVTARDVEKTLETNFNLATKWGCILLLDEADVFLSQRNKEDFVRNGLVAAFLRVLEYYAGILFLTTNRVGDFDEAFTSHIHMSLYYPVLNRDKTLGIFDLNFKLIKDRFERMGRTIKIDHDGIKRFAEMHFWYYHDSRWNGRQIRNACQTALALAEYQAQGDSNTSEYDPKATVTLTVGDFEIVRDAYLEFAVYLSDLYGANTAHLAEERFLRTKGSFDEERDLPLTTEQLYKRYNKEMSQRTKRIPRQHQSDTGMNRRVSYLETQQNRSEQQPRYSSSMRGRNNAETSSYIKARQPRGLLRPQKSAQPQPPIQQQQQFEGFPDDDDEHSEMLQQQQELDDVSYDEQEEDNGYDSVGEQSIPVITTDNSRQGARRLDRRRR
ncbi:hypothetical protein TGAM01_v203453 [Trichoderma gamsii]|uniref:Uncharacterized protein n=1 Tax=Trichoderma gamsii TaxID=398673 RepID=A0A2P4ZTR5_9HYPO|nr:hypothetical protein TGAM01_v203453 [Trichoderma gamsii]PON27686.1 hypothetical protein TGAM01_v203453 [Trichoderma gamsii]